MFPYTPVIVAYSKSDKAVTVPMKMYGTVGCKQPCTVMQYKYLIVQMLCAYYVGGIGNNRTRAAVRLLERRLLTSRRTLTWSEFTAAHLQSDKLPYEISITALAAAQASFRTQIFCFVLLNRKIFLLKEKNVK